MRLTRWHRARAGLRGAVLALAASGIWGGCLGSGEGQASGSLFLRGCPPQDPTSEGHPEVPAPLPAFDLAPNYFFGEITRPRENGFSNYDPREIERLTIRLQRSSNRPERTDLLEFLLFDLAVFPSVQATAMAQGQRGVPIVPADVDGTTAPLPPDPALSVRAALALHTSCQYARVQPLFRGYLHISELGRAIGETVAGEFELTAEDARGTRESGMARDVAGQISGWFRFTLRAGQASLSN